MRTFEPYLELCAANASDASCRELQYKFATLARSFADAIHTSRLCNYQLHRLPTGYYFGFGNMRTRTRVHGAPIELFQSD